MIQQPIFVIGAGRSGSSIFHQMLAEHPRLAWMSTLCDRQPDNPARHRALLGAIDLPWIGPLLQRRHESAECYEFWDRYYRGFSRPCRDLRADDVTPAAAARLRSAFERVMTRRRNRLLVKITGWPRLGFLHAIFPDARFVHVYRDGRAFANSLLQVDFWLGWRGPEQWRWGPLPPDLAQEWEAHDRSFVALAGIQWKLLMHAADAAAREIPQSDLLQVRYEDFAEDPVSNLHQVAAFCGLDWSPRFARRLRNYRVESVNHKWRDDLSAAQQDTLTAVIGDDLRRYGYS